MTGAASGTYQAKFDNSSRSVEVVDQNTNSVVATIPVTSTTLPSGFSASSNPPPDKDDRGRISNPLPSQSGSTTGDPPAGWPR
jgi:hypothetical protein